MHPRFTARLRPALRRARRALKPLLAAAALVAGSTAGSTAGAAPGDGAPPLADQGFSYFMGLGQQSISYQEFGTGLPFKSKATTHSPLLVTGALYALSPDLFFSLGSESTYFVGDTREEWKATSTSFNGKTLTSPMLQSNNFSLTHTDTQLLGHYRLRERWFGLGGIAVRSQSFKRHSFTVGPDAAVNTPASTTVEESAAELMLNLGVALQSTQVRGAAHQYSVRATVGMPLARRVENTNSPAVSFNGTKGYDAALEGRYSWALLRDVHVGAWGRLAASERKAQNRSAAGVKYELPRSRLETMAVGVEVLWKL